MGIVQAEGYNPGRTLRSAGRRHASGLVKGFKATLGGREK